ncbi:MAG TPA: hypothetical protein VH684_26720 [Xanthobacteraceae bacterium]|jgi:hypothetical protein
MSPRKAAAATDRRKPKSTGTVKPPPPVKKSTTKVAGERAIAKAANGASAEAKHLAATIERDLREGRLDTLSKEAFQALMAALCKSYGTQLEAGADFLPVADRASVSPTEIMSTTSGLLKAANLAVFELGMWQSWTGR